RTSLGHILNLLQAMKPCNMSEDEIIGPVHPPVFEIRYAEWQSTELRQCMSCIDELFRKDWAGGMRAGNPPRTLTPSKDGSTARVQAPKGLPRNCYDAKWLKSLKAHQVRALDIQETVVDLVIPDNVDEQSDVEIEQMVV
ncbi:hypothetical protein BDW22DRAFT_1334164, partial [Trametopsis cervina]